MQRPFPPWLGNLRVASFALVLGCYGRPSPERRAVYASYPTVDAVTFPPCGAVAPGGRVRHVSHAIADTTALARLVVQILSADSGERLAGGAVSVGGRRAADGSRVGDYVLDSLVDGRARASIRRIGYRAYADFVLLRAGHVDTLVVLLGVLCQ